METQQLSDTPATDLRWFLDRLPVAAYICDPEGLITYYNENAVAIWGRRPALNDRRDRYCGSFKLFEPDGTPIPHEDCWMGLAIRNQKQYDGEEIVIECENGSRATVLAHANPIYDSAGRLTGAVNVLVDITERKMVLDELRLADKRKDAFLALLSHEMRNPLATVRNAIEIIRNEKVTPTTQEAVAVIGRQIPQLVRLVDDLIDISRITFGRMELRKVVVDLSASLEAALECSRSIIDGRGHKVVLDLPNEPIYLSADPSRLAQILTNLVTNAAKYTPPRGQIRISTRVQGGVATVEITDNGIGIAPEKQDLIFENFAQIDPSVGRSNSGLGIGLNVARQLALLHGGNVTVSSEGLGQGSTFTLGLPMLAEH